MNQRIDDRPKRRARAGVVSLLGLLLLSSLVSAVSAKDATLIFEPEKHKTLTYKVEMQQEMSFGPMVITANQSGVAEISFLEKLEEGAKFSVKFTKIEASIMRGGDIQEQDLGVEGKNIFVTVSDQGEVTDTQPETQIDSQTLETIKNVIEQMFAYLPNKKIKSGGSWIQKISEEGDEGDGSPTLDGQIEYTLEKVKKHNGIEVAEIIGEGKIKIHADMPMGELTGEADGEWEGKVALDGGYVVTAKGSVEIKGKMGEQKFARFQSFECKLIP